METFPEQVFADAGGDPALTKFVFLVNQKHGARRFSLLLKYCAASAKRATIRLISSVDIPIYRPLFHCSSLPIRKNYLNEPLTPEWDSLLCRFMDNGTTPFGRAKLDIANLAFALKELPAAEAFAFVPADCKVVPSIEQLLQPNNLKTRLSLRPAGELSSLCLSVTCC